MKFWQKNMKMLSMKDYEVFGFPGGSVVKNPPAMRETWVWSLGGEDPLEKGMTPHSSTLAWETPWTEQPAGLQSMGLQKSDTNNWLNHHHREDFVQRQEDPTFYAKAAAHQRYEAAAKFCEQNPTLSRSRNSVWSWGFTQVLSCEILQPALIWMEISKRLQPFSLFKGCWWAWCLQPRELCRKPWFRWKNHFGFLAHQQFCTSN